jgi:NaMN:DMB phosphoribosyltransferase
VSDPRVLRHVIDAITPASAAHAEGARLLVARAATPVLERIAMALAGAQHTARPRTERRALLVVAGDHGVGDPGLALGAA